MTVNAPDTGELVDHVLAFLDAAAETRTEDNHPAPELVVQLAAGNYPIFGVTPEAFADTAFDLWERIRVTDVTVARFDPSADAGLAPERTAAAIERIRDHALADLTFYVARHLGQPARPVEARCPSCGGLNGAHGLVHVRFPEGGGGTNQPCPVSL